MLSYSDDPINYFHLAHNYDKNLKNKDKAVKYYNLFIKKDAEKGSIKQNSDHIKTARFHIKKLKEDLFWGE